MRRRTLYANTLSLGAISMFVGRRFMLFLNLSLWAASNVSLSTSYQTKILKSQPITPTYLSYYLCAHTHTHIHTPCFNGLLTHFERIGWSHIQARDCSRVFSPPFATNEWWERGAEHTCEIQIPFEWAALLVLWLNESGCDSVCVFGSPVCI